MENIQKIAAEFNEKNGRSMMFDEAYGIIETSYNLQSALYNHEWSVKRNQAELYAESVRQFALIELRADTHLKDGIQESIFHEVVLIVNDSDDEEEAIHRIMKLYTVNRKEIDKSVKP